MKNDLDPQSQNPGLIRRLMTPPLAYAVYLAAFLAVAYLSFFVGTLAPKKPPAPILPTAAAPR